MIKVSDTAKQKVIQLMTDDGFDATTDFVRVGVKSGGCSRSSDGDVAKNQGQNDAWVVKINTEGQLVWETTVGGTDIDFAYDAVQLNNGTIIAVGESNSLDGDITENKGFTDLLIIKIK